MKVSESISLSEKYIGIDYRGIRTFGGNQNWFMHFPTFREKLIHHGGCGLIASLDLVSYYQKKSGKPLLYEDRESYMSLVKKHTHLLYPLFPKAGSFSFELPFYVNHLFRKSDLPLRLHYLFTFSKKKRLDLVKRALSKAEPLILIIGQHFLRFGCKKGVTFYRFSDGQMIPVYRDVFCHYVNVTGMVIPQDISKSIYLEVASWGEKFYISFEELDHYISKYSFPTFSGFFYVK